MPRTERVPLLSSSTKRDDETGLLYYGFRYYLPGIGTWLSRDPIEEVGGLNLYGMVGNDPLNTIDFLGLADTELHHVIKINPPRPDIAHPRTAAAEPHLGCH